ncbi:MAG: AI-2E family transporter [Dinoroseobacter sp.]|nr:AI-2E family transporter [Dinoroseobacter sp.]
MTNLNTPSDDFLRWLSLLLITLLVSVLFLDMVQSFLVALALAAIASAMSVKLFAKAMGITKNRKGFAASLTLLVLMIAVVAPLVLVSWLAVDQAQAINEAATALVAELSQLSPDEPLPDWVPFADVLGQYSGQIAAKVSELASAIGSFLISALGSITRGTASFFLSLFVFVYALFVFLQMDRPIIDLLLSYSGLAPETQAALRDRMISVSRATLKGTFLIGIVQGALGGLGFWAAGIEGAAFWGVVMAVFSVIPGIGPGFIVFCGVVWLFSQGMMTPAIGLAVWGMAVVGTIDNLLRPILVGRDAAMNDIVILISTLGGLAAFGAAGLVLGPVLAGLFVTLWDTLATHRIRAPKAPSAEHDQVSEKDDGLDEELAKDLVELKARKAERDRNSED